MACPSAKEIRLCHRPWTLADAHWGATGRGVREPERQGTTAPWGQDLCVAFVDSIIGDGYDNDELDPDLNDYGVEMIATHLSTGSAVSAYRCLHRQKFVDQEDSSAWKVPCPAADFIVEACGANVPRVGTVSSPGRLSSRQASKSAATNRPIRRRDPPFGCGRCAGRDNGHGAGHCRGRTMD